MINIIFGIILTTIFLFVLFIYIYQRKRIKDYKFQNQLLTDIVKEGYKCEKRREKHLM